MKIFELNPESPEPNLLHEIGSLLKKGGIIAYPTDTFYAVGGDAFNHEVHHRVRIMKGREANKPFPFIMDKAERLAEWGITLSPLAAAAAERFWPGPLSLIIQDSGTLPADVVDARGTLCVRVPANRIARTISGSVGGLVIATSANPAGKKPARTAREATSWFKGEVDAVVDGGPSPSSLPSTIVEVTGRKMIILREGVISVDQLMALTNDIDKEIFFQEGNGS
ncbi:MAG: threonylcarbamoyl-AMP synthase [Candidatus Abyssobacteria bacterium SURF_5]|uniref:L-threonylcarbamoyladenylate synthase n=1 Tax=Abyssobacteria bacterium (strain SURF_5) TaxID=2093360 RepID=A0A3A4NT82_ABYX5|nr:MAG: threonylcarbamoyl-AMP synthase [Candidatus Abyssubacteria bacterium SURF_5]